MSIAELQALPSLDKWRIIETLWNDMVNDTDEIPVPSWHESVLRETEARYNAGLMKSLDWETAKKELRQRFE
jgi:hypothetical protein